MLALLSLFLNLLILLLKPVVYLRRVGALANERRQPVKIRA
jgi:hypothetical protein